MTAAANIALKEPRRTSLALLLPILLGLTFVRLIGLRFSVVDLFYDEAQYWAWSRDLAFGYSSKPPFLAWIIAVAETVCGSSEACIRAPAPVLYFGTCLATYGVAKVLYDERTAFWAALLVVLAPGAIFSARIISTDVPLMFCWALALLFYLKLLGTSRLGWGIMFGLAFGLGLLAKYAMIYFLLGVALAAIFDPDARALLRKPALWLGFAIAAAIVAPNILWNAEHRFVTFVRVGENVKGEGFGFDPLQMPAFLLAQFAVIGPIAFMVLIFAFVRMRSSTLPRADRLMLAFAIPPLALVTAAALVTKVNSNWAASSFVSGAILAAAILVRRNAWKWLVASVAIGAEVQVLLLTGDAIATRVRLPDLLGERRLSRNHGLARTRRDRRAACPDAGSPHPGRRAARRHRRAGLLLARPAGARPGVAAPGNPRVRSDVRSQRERGRADPADHGLSVSGAVAIVLLDGRGSRTH